MSRLKSRPRINLPQGLVKKFPAHEAEIHCIQISRDGALIATGSQDKQLNLYDARTGSLTRSLAGLGLGVMSIEFSGANDLILGTSVDNSIKIWNLSTARVAHSLTGHIGKVFSACFAGGGASGKVISGSHDRTIKVWDLQKGNCSKTLFTLSSCNDLCSLDYEGMFLMNDNR
jgi:autophagy-related protein 16